MTVTDDSAAQAARALHEDQISANDASHTPANSPLVKATRSETEATELTPARVYATPASRLGMLSMLYDDIPHALTPDDKADIAAVLENLYDTRRRADLMTAACKHLSGGDARPESPTMQPHHPRGLEVCSDCGQHVDAPIHHTPQRLSGEHGPVIGTRMADNPLQQGAILLACALTPKGFGWGPLAGLAHRALLDLTASGWTPPAGQSGDQAVKLRAMHDRAQTQITELRSEVHRLSTVENAAKASRDVLQSASFGLIRTTAQALDAKADNEKRYTRQDLHDLLVKALTKILKEADEAAADMHAQTSLHEEQHTGARELTQLALFGPDATGAGR